MTKDSMKITKRCLMVWAASFLWGAPLFAAITIDEIRIENLEKVVLEDSFVRAYTSLRAGRNLENEAELNAAVAQDVDSLRRSEHFSYVRAFVEQTEDQLTLVYSVDPRVRLRQIEVTGAHQIGSRKIQTELGLERGDYVDEALIGEKVRQVEAYGRKNKYPDIRLTWELTDDEKTEGANLTVAVSEGAKLRVKSIRFKGERFLSDRRFARMSRFFKKLVPGSSLTDAGEEKFEAHELKRLLHQKTTWWITSWFGVHQPELAEADRTTLRAFYLDHGFLDVEVDEPEVRSLGREGIELIYSIREGEPYRIGTVDFEGVALFDPTELEKQIRLHSDQIASRAAIDRAASTIQDYYGNRGYIRSYVRPIIQTDPLTRTANIRFEVHEGSLAYIHEIILRGNEKTRDEVLRRELAVYPGELFHQQKVATSEKRLENLNYFETVHRSYGSAAETNQYDLTFDVKEKAMGSFLVGAGFSTVDSLVGFAEMSHGNFDINRWPPVGDGQKMKIRLQMGSERNDAEISFVEPWFRDRKLALGIDLFSRSADFYSDEYTLKTVGGRVSLSKPLGTFTRGTLSYSLEAFNVSGVSTSAPSEIVSEKGERTKSTVGFTISRDTRDQFFIPTLGNRSSATVEFSGGPLGGDTEICLIELKSSHFWSLWKEHVLNLRGAVRMVESYGSGEVPIFDRLFLGGPRSIRGFAYRDVSPRSKDKGSDEPIGGNSSYFGSIEYTVPLWNKIRGAIFYDIGVVNESAFSLETSALNSSYGFGVRFDLPMFPLRLDYAFPQMMDKANENASPRWNFLLGYSF